MTEFKEYSSFMRFFSSRMVQAVVQARMGKMLPHPCTPNPDPADYFNLVIDEIGEISAYLKSTIGKNYPPTSAIMTLEFILYTDDGDTLPLEAWFCLFFVFEGEPDLAQLGDEYKFKKLGQFPTPFGALFIELNYRTKMEIQPQPFVDEATMIQKVVNAVGNTPLMVAVPQEGSETVPISPISTGNINLFSTRFAVHILKRWPWNVSSCFKASILNFPQHLSAHNKVRMRNNSFPFASLLLESQSSTSQTLPKIRFRTLPKTASNIQKKECILYSRNFIRPMTGKVLFGCGEIEQIGKDDETEKRLEDGESEAQSRGGEEEEEEEQSSDSSFVKVIAFADGISSDELGTDLCEFVKEVKLAPDDLCSFSSEPVVNLSRQLEDFRAKKFTFNKFVADVSQMEGEHSMVQEDER
uniref:HORMA domain-containing protein n=1 Tax=Globodera pallida TaxID=36090 RepID=A0A183CFP9_GLOPA